MSINSRWIEIFQPAGNLNAMQKASLPKVPMGEVPISRALGLRVTNLEIAQRIQGLLFEAQRNGKELSFQEAKQTALAEGFRLE